tara:strand:- start:1062 stop:1841 length:780 start_codon:yes stop_codon:yes gene_type:complete
MAIRKQIYTWELHGDGGDGTDISHYPSAGISHSILYGDFGAVQAGGQTGLVKENEFVVIESIASTPGISANSYRVEGVAPNITLTKWLPNMFVNIVIDTTNYYQDPQNVYAVGVSGTASSYPREVEVQPYYELWPPVYVLPHQTVDIRYTLYNDITLSAGAGVWNTIPITTLMAAVYVEYTLYDGTDAMMAQKLMQLGIPITVATVENYRRLLLEHKGLETDTFNHYLKLMESEREREEKERKNQGVARYTQYTSEDEI